MFVKYKLLLLAVIGFLNVTLTLQNPMAQNYSSTLLRAAKSAQVSAYLDTEQEPCNNFYEFACGKWNKIQPAKIYDQKTSYLEQLDDLYLRKSQQILQTHRKTDNNVDKKLKDFYVSCINVQDDILPLLKLVNLKGGWPKVISPSWYEYEYDWLKLVAELRRKLGVDILIGLDIIPDFEVKDTHRIKVGAPNLKLVTRDAYLDDAYEDKREEYKHNISQVLSKYFVEMPKNWANEIAQQVLHVEQQLANGLPDNPALSIKETTRTRYAADLKAAYGNYVDLSRYLNFIFNDTIYVQVYETPEDYLSNLVEVIKHTPKLTIANYTMWRVLEKLEYSERNKMHRDDWCVPKIKEFFPHELENMFYRNYNSMEMINEIQSVWADIKKLFREELQTSPKLNFISIETRQRAQTKLDAMDVEILAHNNFNFHENLSNLKLQEDTYFQNLINILQWQTERQLAKLIQPPEDSQPELKLPKYQILKNKIQIPLVFLQPRFLWDSEYPNALKYATIGFLLAQEMLHGFDVIGRKYDSHGYQRNWWEIDSEVAFDERSDCFVHQYVNYKFRGNKISNPDTLRSSIADNGGLAIAYRAYQNWWQNMADSQLAENENLPRLKYTQNQIFFIGFAQLHCADYHESVKTFPQLPEQIRVNGALANSNDFKQEFKCEDGSPMSLKHKCTIY